MVSTVGSWLYLWLSWSLRGATPGQSAWSLRVEPVAGGRLSARQALVRCVGYFLACLPLRIGLLPIFWDPWRQGWHDRLAQTIVVDSRRPRQPLPDRPERRCPPLPIDLARPRRGALWALGGYLLPAVVMTWPLVAQFGSARPGGPCDADHFLWNYWYFSCALETGRSLTSTDLLFRPQTASLRLHTMNWFNCALAVPLLPRLGLVRTHNLLVLPTMAGSALALYWLVTSLVRQRVAGFIVGLAFGFSPYLMVRVNGRMNLLAAEFLAVFALLAYHTLLTEQAC